MRKIEEVLTDYIDDQNLQYIDCFFVGAQQGQTAAVVCRDTQKVISFGTDLIHDPEVQTAIKEVLSGIEASNSNKKKDVAHILLRTLATIGMDPPTNIDEIIDFVYEDVCETADFNMWNDCDVVIGFRRWIESKSKGDTEF